MGAINHPQRVGLLGGSHMNEATSRMFNWYYRLCLQTAARISWSSAPSLNVWKCREAIQSVCRWKPGFPCSVQNWKYPCMCFWNAAETKPLLVGSLAGTSFSKSWCSRAKTKANRDRRNPQSFKGRGKQFMPTAKQFFWHKPRPYRAYRLPLGDDSRLGELQQSWCQRCSRHNLNLQGKSIPGNLCSYAVTMFTGWTWDSQKISGL